MYQMMKARLYLLGIFVTLVALSFTWPAKLEKKIHTAISKTYDIQEFSIGAVTLEPTLDATLSRPINDHLYKVDASENVMGYIYVGQAPSMKNVFDFAILFDTDFNIINAKVLIYREQHGRQIGMKRWLSQFFGLAPSDRPALGDNIDGISGATISARSMTDATRDVLASIEAAKSKGGL